MAKIGGFGDFLAKKHFLPYTFVYKPDFPDFYVIMTS